MQQRRRASGYVVSNFVSHFHHGCYVTNTVMDTNALFLLFVRLTVFTCIIFQDCETRFVLHGIRVISDDHSQGPTNRQVDEKDVDRLPSELPSESCCTHRPVILDCVYDVIPYTSTHHQIRRSSSASLDLHNPATTTENISEALEKAPSTHHEDLVVKWFRNNELVPLYTWIPAIGQRLFHHAYQDVVDPLYKHNDKELEMFRAIRVLKPTASLSGNFTCLVEVATVDRVPDANGNREELPGDTNEVLQAPSRTIYFYEPPSEFEVRLNLSTPHIYCAANTPERLMSSIEISIYQVDYDAFEMPLNNILLSSTTVLDSINDSTDSACRRAQNTFSSGCSETTIEASLALTPADVKVVSEGWSRDFICEIVYKRVKTPERLAFQRSIRLIHETHALGFSADEFNGELLPEAHSWQTSDTPIIGHYPPSGVVVYTALLILYLMYTINALKLP